MINKRIVEQRINTNTSIIHATRYKFTDYNIVDILTFAHAQERINHAFTLLYTHYLIKNLKNLKSRLLSQIRDIRDNKDSTQEKHYKLLQEAEELFLMVLNTQDNKKPIIDLGKLKEHIRNSELETAYKLLIVDINRHIKKLVREKKKSPNFEISIYDIQQAYKHKYTETARKQAYFYLRIAQARKTDTPEKAEYIQNNPYVVSHFDTPQIEHIKPILFNRIEAKFKRFQYLNFITDEDKNNAYKDIMQYIGSFQLYTPPNRD